MSIFNILSSLMNVVSAVVRDDNGHAYKDDNGGYIPNNEYDLDGVHYKTDDNGSIYSANGSYYPDDIFVVDGTWYSTDENGKVTNE